VKNDWLKAIRGLLRFAVPTMLKVDPTSGIKVKLPKSKGHHNWTDEEIASIALIGRSARNSGW
jgi:hypothetical protein